ncbi:uncharacterized protein KD926_001871 [Aspergillus affinis]|uniref:uncharacterized protein n=1 Tax=Aspergillus affinis TaxID=1070780 RepID=UPI0022FE62A7|nr:uncharacterized protein KD926_001871 [Aspergillus affinis]KAI9044049.1 hypothetical protein KD926_001871 [Aspergillus affinis]
MTPKPANKGSGAEHTLLPASRLMPPDLSSPTFDDLLHLALFRVCDAALCLDTRPPRLFPTAETVFGRYFTVDDWRMHGDLETAMGRMNYMLSDLPERGVPASCHPAISSVLSSSSVLATWRKFVHRLECHAKEESEWIIGQMQSQQSNSTHFAKSDFITAPVDYRTIPSASEHAMALWHRSLSEIALQVSQDHFEDAKSFLQIFAFLKDPLGGLESNFERAVPLFVYLMASLDRGLLALSNSFAAVAQAAQEALFLSDPLLENVNYVHFSGHQQLPYVYVALNQLPRSEFSIPGHVLHIIEEMLASAEQSAFQTCEIAPISVASYPSLPIGQGKHTTVIIDGNHRATATMVLRLIAMHPVVLKTQNADDVLSAFCADHGLSLKWKIDLADVLAAIRDSPCCTLIRAKMHLVQNFRTVDTIPALVVREDNFFTACQQRPALRDRPRLLLPIHQALYNDEKLKFAFPQAGQVHGRAVGFKPMPLLHSSSVDVPDFADNASKGDFHFDVSPVVNLEL